MNPLRHFLEMWQLWAGFAVVLSTAASVVCGVAVRRNRATVEAAETRCRQAQELSEESIRSLQAALEALSAQMRDLPRDAAPGPAPSPLFKSGLNLNKRSQVLRMHRRGDRPEEIAAALELPLQEVDLLLKVHRIVLSTV